MAAGGTTTLVNLLKVKSNDLLVGNGVTGTGSLRVTIASDNSALAVSQSGTWTLSTLTNVQQFNGTAISMKAASTAAAATDTSLVVALSPNTALPAGTNAIGKLTANTGVTIGAVEIAGSQTLSTVTSLTQFNGNAIATNTGVRSAGTLRVTIATDDVVPASQSGTWNINTLTSITNALPAGTNNIGDVDVLTLPSIPAGTNNIGDVDIASIAAGTNTIGKVDVNQVYAEDAASTGGENLFLSGAVRQDTIAATTTADGDYTYLKTNNLGRLYTSTTIDAALPAGTNAIGKLAANDGVDIGDVTINNAISAGAYVRVTDGTNTMPTGDAAARGVFHRITDGTNTVAVKAANVAPALADPALVVALSPNSQQLTTPSGVPSVATASTGGSLAASTTYFFKLVAVDAGGGTTIPGPEASIATAVGTATNTITITWPPIPGADSYQVWWSTTTGTQGSYFPAPINLSTSGTLTNSYVFSTVTGTFSGTIPTTNTTSFVRKKAIQPVSITPNQTITVTQATAANLNATVTGTVELGATSLAALENISVTVPGTVDLGTISLTALETITVISGTPGDFQSKVYGAVTTAAPAYTDATNNALSLTTSGALRVDGSAVTQPVSIAASVAVTGPLTSAQTLTALTNLVQFNGTAISMKAASTAAVVGDTALVVSVSPNTAVNLAADDVHDGVAGTTGVMITGFASSATPAGVSADGDAARLWVSRNGAVIIDGYTKQGTATAIAVINGTLTLQLGGSKAAGITITAISTPVGITLTPQVSFDGGTNWTTTAFKNLGNGDTFPTLTNANLIVGVSASIIIGGGASHVRVIALAYGSGSVTVQWSASESVDTSELFVASNNSAQRPISTAQVGGWDGTNLRALSVTTAGAVNIGSIASALPTGTNSIGNIGTVSTVTNLSQLGGAAIAMGTGVRSAGTQRVTIATDDIVQTKATPDATGTYAGTNATTTVYATNLVIKASAGTVYMLSGYNSLATAQFIQLHNATALPADTSVPSVIFYVPGLSNFSFDFGVYGRFFSTGVVVCNSTTGPTKTIGAANCWFDAQFK
jgi:hypothetical protein